MFDCKVRFYSKFNAQFFAFFKATYSTEETCDQQHNDSKTLKRQQEMYTTILDKIFTLLITANKLIYHNVSIYHYQIKPTLLSLPVRMTGSGISSLIEVYKRKYLFLHFYICSCFRNCFLGKFENAKFHIILNISTHLPFTPHKRVKFKIFF